MWDCVIKHKALLMGDCTRSTQVVTTKVQAQSGNDRGTVLAFYKSLYHQNEFESVVLGVTVTLCCFKSYSFIYVLLAKAKIKVCYESGLLRSNLSKGKKTPVWMFLFLYFFLFFFFLCTVVSNPFSTSASPLLSIEHNHKHNTLKQLIPVNIGVSSCPLSLLAVNQACWSALTVCFTEGLTK